MADPAPSSSAPGTARVRLLRLDDGADARAAVQRVLDGAPRYARLIGGGPPDPAAARQLFEARPPAIAACDKFVFGVFGGMGGGTADGPMVGVVDLIRGHPDDATAFIGLLLIDEAHERRGLGRATLAAIERFVRRWPGVRRLRLGVLRDNERAQRFWTAAGFVATGECKPFVDGAVRSEVLLFDKPIARPVPRR